MTRGWPLAWLAACLLIVPLPATAERTLQAADRWSMAWVGDPQLSPEGDWVAYTVSGNDRRADASRSRLWMVPLQGGEPLALTAETASASQPRWSPDGRYLSFLSSRDGKPAQVWVLDRRGGEAQPLTDTPQAVEDYAWSPDGTSLALVLKDLEPGHAQALADGESWTAPRQPWVIDRVQFKQDYVGYLDRRRTHIYRFDLADRGLHQLTAGDQDDSAPAWSPDGSQLVFVSKRVEGEPDLSTNTDLFLVSSTVPEAGVQEPRRLTSGPGSDSAPAWSPDGRSIAHLTTLNPDRLYYETQHLAVTDLRSGQTRVLTESLDRWVYTPRFDHTGQHIVFVLEDSGELQLARMPSAGGEVERLVKDMDVVQGFAAGPAGELVVRVSRPDSPPELYRLQDGALQALTSANAAWRDALKLGDVRKVTSTHADGTPIESFLVLPPDYDPARSYPTILNIHGGPQMQYDGSFNFESQLLAAQGYLVLLPNPRGSTGYGFEFCLAIWQDWGGIDYEDLMAVVDDMIGRGWADADRLGVMGWSYGGMMTNHIITKTDRFKAAVTGASATLYVATYGHDEYVAWWEQEFGKPWLPEARALYEKLSPFNQLDKVTTPTLVVGGEKDWNVPILGSEQLYLVLKRRGVDTQLIVYPDEFHGIDTPSMEQDLYQRHIDWFDRYLGSD